MIVPLNREVKFGTRGPDALAVKRALTRKGYGQGLRLSGKLANVFGPIAVRNLKRWKKRVGQKQTGVYGGTAHKAMVASRGFDRYGAWLMAKAPSPNQSSVQSKIVATALLGWHENDQIHYTQDSRRMQGVRERIRPPHVPHYEDCSSFATWCFWIAGAPDPNGLGYNGYGFTGTQIRHGRKVSNARAGDLVFYGNKGGVPTHVAIAVGGGKVVGHGSEIGPVLALISYRRDIHSIRRYV